MKYGTLRTLRSTTNTTSCSWWFRGALRVPFIFCTIWLRLYGTWQSGNKLICMFHSGKSVCVIKSRFGRAVFVYENEPVDKAIHNPFV